MAKNYFIRLDDASDYMNVPMWNRVEQILDSYNIKPLVGIIPNNKDAELTKYERDLEFWSKVEKWESKGWTMALHGYDHVYLSDSGGLNPVNQRSEFAGIPYAQQSEKISKGLAIMNDKGVFPNVFFAPSHTFDRNTLLALKENSDIRIISDTIANDIYYENDFYFIPQQSGKVRNLPFKFTTFCYHPNNMIETDFIELDSFLKKNGHKFISFKEIHFIKRKLNCLDRFYQFLYFKLRR